MDDLAIEVTSTAEAAALLPDLDDFHLVDLRFDSGVSGMLEIAILGLQVSCSRCYVLMNPAADFPAGEVGGDFRERG